MIGRTRAAWISLTASTLVIGLCLVILAGCSKRELSLWAAWHEQDPAAAAGFAEQPDIQAQLATPEPGNVWDRGWTVNWNAVAACESGGNWSHPPVTNSTGTYSGGLMWSQRYWPIYGGDFAPWAYQATKAEQIAAAERLVNGSHAEADRAWDCL